MTREQARSTRFLLWCALLLLSLRPVAPVSTAVAWAAAPLRVVSELAAPLRLFERRTLLAAERTLAASAAEEAEASVRIRRDLQRGAEPSDPALRVGRRLVGGEVRGRDPEDEDRILVRLYDVSGLVPGLPVVCGNAYVGRVVDVVGDGVSRPGGVEYGLATVELVTAARFHVGASVERGGATGQPVYCTVGGLHVSDGPERQRPDARQLVLHNPSDRTLQRGVARVDELFDDAETFAELSRGFELGDVERLSEAGWGVRPRLDYEDGLFQVVVLAPVESRPPARAFPELATDAQWRVARPLVAAVPGAWREAAVIDLGSLAKVEVGAAVTAIGERLVGRVSSVGPTTARVSFAGDPGFQIVAVARVDGLREPLVLGRLVSKGRDPQTGDVLLRWLNRVEQVLPGEGPTVAARLFSGSGDPGLESGYFLGRAELPRASRGPLIVRLEAELAPHALRRLFVRVDSMGLRRVAR